jgi:hypothetical protein
MTNHKKPTIQSTREVVETAIDLTKLDKSASWERLAHGERHTKCWQGSDGKRPPAQRREKVVTSSTI